MGYAREQSKAVDPDKGLDFVSDFRKAQSDVLDIAGYLQDIARICSRLFKSRLCPQTIRTALGRSDFERSGRSRYTRRSTSATGLLYVFYALRSTPVVREPPYLVTSVVHKFRRVQRFTRASSFRYSFTFMSFVLVHPCLLLIIDVECPVVSAEFIHVLRRSRFCIADARGLDGVP